MLFRYATYIVEYLEGRKYFLELQNNVLHSEKYLFIVLNNIKKMLCT